MELSLLILVYIHKSYIVCLEIYVVPIGHGFSFFVHEKVMENQCWKRGGTLQICELYAQEYSMTFSFNAKKSKYTVAAPRNRRHLLLSGNICPFVIDGSSIDFVDSFLHLGHIISSVSGDNEDISHRRCKVYWTNQQCTMWLLEPWFRWEIVCLNLFCSDMYGCELWHLENCKISDFCIAWRKALRRIWNVPYNTHCELLYCLCNNLPVFDETCKCSLRFIAACLSHHWFG